MRTTFQLEKVKGRGRLTVEVYIKIGLKTTGCVRTEFTWPGIGFSCWLLWTR